MNALVGLVGCGYWGSNLARSFSRLGVLGAIADASPAVTQAKAAENGVRGLSIEALINDPQLQAVAVATPAETHAAVALAALAAGKHVFVEKPIALNEQDAAAVSIAAEKAGKTVMVGHLLQYHPAFEALLGFVRSGELGSLRYVYSHRLSLGKLRDEENALWSFAPHDLSMVLALYGDAEPITVAAAGDSYVTPGIDDWNRLELRFPAGGSAHIFASWLHPFKEHRLTVVGERSMAVFEDSASGKDKLRLYRHEIGGPGAAMSTRKAEPEYIPYADDEPLLRECAHFVECIENGFIPRTDVSEAMRVLRVLQRATHPSARAR